MADEKTDVKVVDIAAAAGSQNGAAATAADQGKYVFGGKTYNSVEDLGKAYEALQSEYGKWTSKYGELEKLYKQTEEQAKKWNEWWETVKPLWGDDVEELLRRKLLGQVGGSASTQAQRVSAAQQAATQAAQAAQSGQDFWEGYDLLTPREQAARLYQAITDGLTRTYQTQLAQLAQAINNTLGQKEQWYQSYLNNYLGLLRKSLEQKFKDPNFDIDKTMEAAAQALSGQVDPLQLGQQLLTASTFQSQLEAAKKAAYEQGRKDYEQELQNKKQEAVPPVGGPPKYKVPVVAEGSKRGLLGFREKAAETIYKNFGPQWFAKE